MIPFINVFKWPLIVLIASLTLFILLFGFVAGFYCNKYNHGGPVSRKEIPSWIIYGLYPSSKIMLLARYNMWSAQVVNPKGSQNIESIIITFYFNDKELP